MNATTASVPGDHPVERSSEESSARPAARPAAESRRQTPRVWSGVWPAIVTPFDATGQIDRAALGLLVDHVRQAGVDGIVVLGTTGEAASLDALERDVVIATALDRAGGLPVVVGTGSNNSRDTARQTRRARELGAAGALVVTPYYVRPNREGLLGHYRMVLDAAGDLPIMLYNVPGRTGIDLGAELALELLELPGVRSIKEASGNLSQIQQIARGVPSGRSVLAGDDHLTFAAVTHGATGVVSVVANVWPERMVELVRAARASELELARRCHDDMAPLVEALFCESNPVPVKAALDLLGRASGEVRLPLARAGVDTYGRLRTTLVAAGLLEVAA